MQDKVTKSLIGGSPETQESEIADELREWRQPRLRRSKRKITKGKPNIDPEWKPIEHDKCAHWPDIQIDCCSFRCCGHKPR